MNYYRMIVPNGKNTRRTGNITSNVGVSYVLEPCITANYVCK